MTDRTFQLIAIGIYFATMLAIGYYAYRQTSDLEDYMLGGRKLRPGVAALSAGASDMSGWLLMGLPGAIFVSGLSKAWIVIGLVIGAYCNWKFVAPRLRTYTEIANNSITVPSFFEIAYMKLFSPVEECMELTRALNEAVASMVIWEEEPLLVGMFTKVPKRYSYERHADPSVGLWLEQEKHSASVINTDTGEKIDEITTAGSATDELRVKAWVQDWTTVLKNTQANVPESYCNRASGVADAEV